MANTNGQHEERPTMTASDWYDGRERDTEGNKIKQGDAGMKIAGVSEIGFDSKPISEIG